MRWLHACSAAVLLAAFLAGCMSRAPESSLRVGSYNIRLSAGDRGTPNAWVARRADLVALVRNLDLDVFGLQEVMPDQAAYLRANLPDYSFVGEHREADRVSGEASPVCYRTERFDTLRAGTFWLSETPDTPGRKGWDAAHPRVCSYLLLKDRTTGRIFCFANTHTDNRSARAREEGMKLILARMKDFGDVVPVVFTGDHNCQFEDPPAAFVRTRLHDARMISETPLRGPHNTFQGFGRYPDGPVKRKTGEIKDYCIDYIYVSDGTHVLDFETHDARRPGTDLYPSDHRPITATIVLPR